MPARGLLGAWPDRAFISRWFLCCIIWSSANTWSLATQHRHNDEGGLTSHTVNQLNRHWDVAGADGGQAPDQTYICRAPC
jgi:hypothetical protein